MWSHVSGASICLQRFWLKSAWRIPSESQEWQLQKKQAPTHAWQKSVGQIILAICYPFPMSIKTIYIGYRQVAYSLGQRESTPWFLMLVVSQVPSKQKRSLGLASVSPDCNIPGDAKSCLLWLLRDPKPLAWLVSNSNTRQLGMGLCNISLPMSLLPHTRTIHTDMTVAVNRPTENARE